MKKKKVVFIVMITVFAGLSILAVLMLNGSVKINDIVARAYTVRGVDVSKYQGEIDWERIAEQNIEFAFIKATEGSSHVDQKFAINWANSLKTDMKIGAYHFFSYDSNGKTQAQNFMQNVPIREGTLPPVVDVEFYDDKEQNLPDKKETVVILHDMLTALEKHYKKKPIIYTTQKAYNLYIKDDFSDYPLWIRNVWYPASFTVGDSWAFWQYSDKGILDGYDGDEKFIDLNFFNGSKEQLEKMCKTQ